MVKNKVKEGPKPAVSKQSRRPVQLSKGKKNYVKTNRSLSNNSIPSTSSTDAASSSSTSTPNANTATTTTSTNGNAKHGNCPDTTNSNYSLNSTPVPGVDSDSDDSEYMNVASVIHSIAGDSDTDCSTRLVETCIVCNKDINPNEESTSENLFRELCTKKRLLSALSIVLRISPTTMYPKDGIDFSALPKQIYCSACSKTIYQSISIIRKIENLNKCLDVNKNELKQNFVRSYQEEDDRPCGREKGGTLAAKSRIRKTFVQCFATCEVPLESCAPHPTKLDIKPSKLKKGSYKTRGVGTDDSTARNVIKTDASVNTVRTVHVGTNTVVRPIAKCADGSTNTSTTKDAVTITDEIRISHTSTSTDLRLIANASTNTNSGVDASVNTPVEDTVEAGTMTIGHTDSSTSTLVIKCVDVYVNTNENKDASTITDHKFVGVSVSSATSDLEVLDVDVSTLSGMELDPTLDADSISQHIQSDPTSSHIASTSFDVSINSNADSSTNFIASATSPYFNPDSSTNTISSYDTHSHYGSADCGVSYEPRFNPDCSSNGFDIVSYNSPVSFNPDCSTSTNAIAMNYRTQFSADCSTQVIHDNLSTLSTDCSFSCSPIEDNTTPLRTEFHPDSLPNTNSIPHLLPSVEPEAPESTTGSVLPEPEQINSTNDIVLTAGTIGLARSDSLDTSFPCGSRAELESLEDFNFSLLDAAAHCGVVDVGSVESLESGSQDSSSPDNSTTLTGETDGNVSGLSPHVPYPLPAFVEVHEQETTSVSASGGDGDDSESTNSQTEATEGPPRKFITKAAMKEYQECPRRKLGQQVKVKAQQVTRRRKQGKFKVKTKQKQKRVFESIRKRWVSKVLKVTKEQREGNYKYKCNICGKGYNMEKFFIDHQKYHNGEYDFTCSKCNRPFSSASHLRLHQMQIHSNTEEIPVKPTSLKTSLPTIPLKDAKGKMQYFKCSHCELSFYKKHYRVDTGAFVFKCELGCSTDEKTYSRFVHFMRHHKKACSKFQLSISKPHEAKDSSSEVNPVLSKASKLKESALLPPPPPLKPAPTHPPPPRQGTPVRPQLVNVHPIPAPSVDTSTMKIPDEEPSRKKDKSNVNKCETCNKLYATPQSLSVHNATFHSQPLRFICDKCGIGFSFSSHLNAHMSSHTLEFKCELCPRSFTTMRGLGRHTRMSHRPANPDEEKKEIVSEDSATLKPPVVNNKCSTCVRSFPTPELLKKHQNTAHKKSRPKRKKFACSLCKKCFQSRAQVRIHIWAHKRSRQSRKAEYQCKKKAGNNSVEKESDDVSVPVSEKAIQSRVKQSKLPSKLSSEIKAAKENPVKDSPSTSGEKSSATKVEGDGKSNRNAKPATAIKKKSNKDQRSKLTKIWSTRRRRKRSTMVSKSKKVSKKSKPESVPENTQTESKDYISTSLKNQDPATSTEPPQDIVQVESSVSSQSSAKALNTLNINTESALSENLQESLPADSVAAAVAEVAVQKVSSKHSTKEHNMKKADILAAVDHVSLHTKSHKTGPGCKRETSDVLLSSSKKPRVSSPRKGEVTGNNITVPSAPEAAVTISPADAAPVIVKDKDSGNTIPTSNSVPADKADTKAQITKQTQQPQDLQSDHHRSPKKSENVVSTCKPRARSHDKKVKDKEDKEVVSSSKSPRKASTETSRKSHSSGKAERDSRKSSRSRDSYEVRNRSRSRDITHTPSRKFAQDSSRTPNPHSPRKPSHDHDYSKKVPLAPSLSDSGSVSAHKKSTGKSEPSKTAAPAPVIHSDRDRHTSGEKSKDLKKSTHDSKSKTVDKPSSSTSLSSSSRRSKSPEKDHKKSQSGTSSESSKKLSSEGLTLSGKNLNPVVIISRTKTDSNGKDLKKLLKSDSKNKSGKSEEKGIANVVRDSKANSVVSTPTKDPPQDSKKVHRSTSSSKGGQVEDSEKVGVSSSSSVLLKKQTQEKEKEKVKEGQGVDTNVTTTGNKYADKETDSDSRKSSRSVLPESQLPDSQSDVKKARLEKSVTTASPVDRTKLPLKKSSHHHSSTTSSKNTNSDAKHKSSPSTSSDSKSKSHRTSSSSTDHSSSKNSKHQSSRSSSKGSRDTKKEESTFPPAVATPGRSEKVDPDSTLKGPVSVEAVVKAEVKYKAHTERSKKDDSSNRSEKEKSKSSEGTNSKASKKEESRSIKDSKKEHRRDRHESYKPKVEIVFRRDVSIDRHPEPEKNPNQQIEKTNSKSQTPQPSNADPTPQPVLAPGPRPGPEHPDPEPEQQESAEVVSTGSPTIPPEGETSSSSDSTVKVVAESTVKRNPGPVTSLKDSGSQSGTPKSTPSGVTVTEPNEDYYDSQSRKRRSERLECVLLEKKRIICIDLEDDEKAVREESKMKL